MTSSLTSMSSRKLDSHIWYAVADDHLSRIEDVAAFLQGEFAPSGSIMWSPEFMRWKLGSSNPAGTGFVSYAMTDGKVVGSVTLVRKRAILDGKEIACGEVGDTYTTALMRKKGKPFDFSELSNDPNHFTNKSIFGRLASDVFKRACLNGVQLVYGTPNQNAYPGWTKRLGYTELLSRPLFCFSRPTSYILAKYSPKLAFLVSPLAALEWVYWKFCRLCAKFASGIIVSQSWPASEEIDALWTHTQPTKGFSLIRDSVYWRHRYEQNPLVLYTVFTFRLRGKLLGMMVCRVTEQESGKRVVSLVDWMAAHSLKMKTMVMLIADRIFEKHRPSVINLWLRDGSRAVNDLRWLLFLRRTKIPVIFGPTELSGNFKHIECFDFTIGSSDAM